MTTFPGAPPRLLSVWGIVCAGCFLAAGCSDIRSDAGVSHSDSERPAPAADSFRGATEPDHSEAAGRDDGEPVGAATVETAGADGSITSGGATASATTEVAVPADRAFAVEGPNGALRISFDDLDLLKVLKMDPVTADCVEKMPGWLRGLAGRPVRIRGFMKPGLLLTDIPQFLLVRDTGLCCFGPKGKIYDMIAVTLKAGTTTDYIELRPFDVVGTFRIQVEQLEEEETIYGLYYIDDAVIVQK